MEHNFFKTGDKTNIQFKIIHQRDNNLDKIDNLDELPQAPAVFAVCGRVNGKPANPRYVGHTDDLRKAVKKLFNKQEPAPEDNECFKEFMLSIKTKELVYELAENVSEEDRAHQKELWVNKYQPKCNEVLNEIH